MNERRPCPAVLMALIEFALVYRNRVRPWMYTWGASDEEVAMTLPGDEMVATGSPRTTRALTIDAPVRAVWPWLAQIGEDRGGFYSYSWLERAVGANIRNANTIHPEWLDLRVGDTVWLARRYGNVARQIVAAVEPESYVILMTPGDFARVQQGEKASGAWGFYLRRSLGWTRLIVRGSGAPVGNAAFDVVHFIMEQKMMRGIRKRAQAAFRNELDALVTHGYPGEGLAAEPVDSPA